jgi:hypothetical protein
MGAEGGVDRKSAQLHLASPVAKIYFGAGIVTTPPGPHSICVNGLKLLGHPAHPAVVHFPGAAWTAVVVTGRSAERGLRALYRQRIDPPHFHRGFGICSTRWMIASIQNPRKDSRRERRACLCRKAEAVGPRHHAPVRSPAPVPCAVKHRDVVRLLGNWRKWRDACRTSSDAGSAMARVREQRGRAWR